MYKTTLAVVLRTENYRENDRMLTLFTQDSGRVEALARGCRKQGSKLSAFAEPFVCAEVQLYEKNNRTTVTQAVIKESFYSLREDIGAFSCASLLVSACEKCIVPESPERKLFALLVNCLYALVNKADPMDTAVFFSLRLLFVLGQGISLSECASCGKKEVSSIDFENGCVLCGSCPGGVSFGSDFISILRLMQSSGVKSISENVYGVGEKEAVLFVEHALSAAQIGVPKQLSFMMKKI